MKKKEPALLFPKQPKRRKRMKHKNSILQEKNGICFLCALLEGDTRQQYGLHKHHVFFGAANRKLSEEDGLYVYLCMRHHETGEMDGILHFLYESDSGAEIPVEICSQIYEVIKNYDDDVLYGYIGRSDCAKFKDFKELVKDCVDSNCSMEWF